MNVVDEIGGDNRETPSGEALLAWFARPDLRGQYRVIAHEAAMLEREGNYDMAMCQWQVAGALAMNSMDKHWCESRAQWCSRRHAERERQAFLKGEHEDKREPYLAGGEVVPCQPRHL